MSAPAWESKGADFSNSSAAPSFAAPAGTAAGKLVIISFYVNVAETTVTGIPSGFAAVPGAPVLGQSNSLQKYWKRLTSADAGTYDFTLSANQFIEGAAELYDSVVDSGSPFDPDPGFAVDNTVGAISPAVETDTVGPDRLILHTATCWAGGTWTPNTGYTKRIQPSVGLVTTSDKQQASAGTTGNVTATSSNSDKRTAHIVALIGTTASSTPIYGGIHEALLELMLDG